MNIFGDQDGTFDGRNSFGSFTPAGDSGEFGQVIEGDLANLLRIFKYVAQEQARGKIQANELPNEMRGGNGLLLVFICEERGDAAFELLAREAGRIAVADLEAAGEK